MRGVDVRAALASRLQVWHPDPHLFVVDELDLLGQVRVDVGVVAGALWGYEIKSAHDTLRRLPKQVEVYSRVLDFAVLVVAECHLDAAQDLLPPWWGIAVAVDDASAVRVDRVRHASPNPGVDASALVQLLWRDEAIELLADRGMDRGVRTKPRRFAWDRLAQQVELPELQTAVRHRLRSRQGWRGPSLPA